jgi:hypothetical protein
MLRGRTWNRGERDGMIEGNKPSSMLHSEREKIDIRDLAWPVNVCGVDMSVFEKTDRARPELMVLGCRSTGAVSRRPRREKQGWGTWAG